MVVETKNFGEIEITDENIYTFDCGIPGFEQLKKFTIIKNDDGSPFCWLQSLENGEISFIIMNVYNIFPDYDPLVYDDDLEDLGEIKNDSLIIYNIVVIPPVISKMSVNLKAPIVINAETKKGKQLITKNEDYPIKYYFYEELKKKNGGE